MQNKLKETINSLEIISLNKQPHVLSVAKRIENFLPILDGNCGQMETINFSCDKFYNIRMH